MSDTAVTHSRSTGITRLVRGWIAAIIAVILAAEGHQAVHSLVHGAADPIPVQLLGLSLAVTAPVAVALAGRGPSKRTAATTIFGQIAFHLLYSMASPGGHAEHQIHTTPAVDAATADVLMVLAHLLAAALTTTAVLYGERSLLAIAAWLTLTPSRVLIGTRPLSIGGAKTVQAMHTVWIPHPLNVCQTRSTRGPPVLA